MVQELLPGVSLAKGRLRYVNIKQYSGLSLGSAQASQSRERIPVRGGIVALGVRVAVTLTGAPSSAETIEKAIASLAIFDKSGEAIWTGVRGQDLPIHDRYLNTGRSRTVPTAATSQTEHYFEIVNPISLAAQEVDIQLTLNTLSAVSGGGSSAGSVDVDLIAWYLDGEDVPKTQRIIRLDQTIGSGTYRMAPDLPENKLITDLLFAVGTESNITNLTFSADGRAELSTVRPSDLTAWDNVRLISGHVTGQFSLYVSPFVAGSNTQLDVVGAGSDTINWYVLMQD